VRKWRISSVLYIKQSIDQKKTVIISQHSPRPKSPTINSCRSLDCRQEIVFYWMAIAKIMLQNCEWHRFWTKHMRGQNQVILVLARFLFWFR